jgi:hypothetical protein
MFCLDLDSDRDCPEYMYLSNNDDDKNNICLVDECDFDNERQYLGVDGRCKECPIQTYPDYE